MASGKTGVTVTVRFNALPGLGGRIRSAGARHAEATADAIAADARARAPVRTGQLRASISRAGSGAEARVVARAPHAGYVEYGTARMPARPYLWPAVEAARAGYVEGWRSILRAGGGGGILGAVRALPARLALGRQARARVRP